MSRCGLLLVLIGLVALAGAAGASGEAVNAYTATGTPQHVKPSSTATYTISIKNDPLSPMEADKAKIGIPAGFVVAGASVQATASAASTCLASTWIADGVLIAGGKINLKRPSGGGSTGRLCPGATLTVVFSATSSAVEGGYVWATELIRDTAFVLNGAQPSVEVDGTAPVVSLGSRPSDPSNDVSPSFGFSANEAATFECKLDGGAFGPCSSPKQYANVLDGQHTFAVKATDAAGNSGAAVTYSWLVETTLPIVTLTAKPSLASNSSAANVSFTVSKPASVECKLDGGGYAPCSSPVSFTALADGPHTFAAKATDAASNSGPETTYSWTIDTVTPVATITQKPGNPSNVASPSFQFSANEASGFQCKLDAAAFAPCTSPKSYGPGDGAHTFTVKATDAAGNSGEASYGWTIDTVAPVPTITQKPANPSNVASPTFQFSVNEAAALQCKLDAAAFAACTSPIAYSPGDGAHAFTLKATDAAGNSAQTAYNWTLDTVRPVVTITRAPDNPSNVKGPTFEFSSEAGAAFQCKVDDVRPLSVCASPWVYANLPDGDRVFTVKATDAAGNVGEATYAWLLETDLPIVTLLQKPTNPTGNSSATFAFIPTKSATLQCRLDASAYAPCDSPKTFNTLPDGSHTFAVRAKDTAGNTGPDTVYTWTIDTVAPAAAITEKPGDPTNNRSAAFSFTASEAGAAFQCRLDDAPFAACASPQLYSALPDGRHTFAVRATDALSNIGTESAYEWTIENRAPAVTLTSVPASLTNSSIARLAFSADEPSTFQCRLDDRALEPCSSPASYGGLGDGGHTVFVRATDVAGNVGSGSYSWTVDAIPPETEIDSRPASKTTATSARFTFSGRGSSRFDCRLDSGAFAPCVSPRAYRGVTAGSHRFIVRAVDAAGNVDATPSQAAWTVTKSGATRTVATTALLAPAAGRRVTRPPRLRWRAVRGATYYNVQVYRSGRKMLSAWPRRTSLQLQSKWRFSGQRMQLSAGRYQWYVWPGYGKPSDRRYGRLLGSSTFIVGRAGRR